MFAESKTVTITLSGHAGKDGAASYTDKADDVGLTISNASNKISFDTTTVDRGVRTNHHDSFKFTVGNGSKIISVEFVTNRKANSLEATSGFNINDNADFLAATKKNTSYTWTNSKNIASPITFTWNGIGDIYVASINVTYESSSTPASTTVTAPAILHLSQPYYGGYFKTVLIDNDGGNVAYLWSPNTIESPDPALFTRPNPESNIARPGFQDKKDASWTLYGVSYKVINGETYYSDVVHETYTFAKDDVTLSFDNDALVNSVLVGSSVINVATATATHYTRSDISNGIKYTSDHPDVATVDATGKVTGVKAGTATITASRPADDYYNEATPVTYTITVQGDNLATSNTATFGYEGSDVDVSDLSAKANKSSSVGGKGDITMIVTGSENGAVSQSPVTDNNTTVNRLKFQIGTSFTISSTSNNITKIEYTVVYSSNRDFDGKTSPYTWEGTEAKSSVTFTNNTSNNIYITGVTVTYTTALGDGTDNTVQTPDYTWAFNQVGSLWDTSKDQLEKYSNAGIAWNHANDKYSIKTPPTEATGYDVDIIRGLRFTGSFYVDPTNHIVYLEKGATVMIPGAAKGQSFSITYDNNGQLGINNLTQDGSPTDKGNGTTESDYTVTADGNVTFTSTSTNGTKLYKISWLQPEKPTEATFAYSNIDGGDTNPRYKVSLSSAGSITGGLQITDIPGMTFQFGKDGDTWTSSYIYDSKGNKRMDAYLAGSSAVKVDPDYVPTNGTYYTFMPNVNGVVTATVLGWGRHQIYLKEDGGDRMAFGKAETTGERNDITFPVTAGKTYYLYSDAIGKQEYQLYLNGFDFEPSFFILDNDGNYERVLNGQSIGTSTMGETFMIPFIMTSKQDTETAKASVSYTGPGQDYVSVDDLGNVTIVQTTDKPTTVTCTITNSTKWNPVTLSYVIDGVKANKEAWVVKSGYQPKIGEEITSIDGIKMTFGGWKQNNDSTYIYNSKDKTDKWSAADGDAAARDENNLLTHSLDGFLYATSGAQDGKSETLGNSQGKASDHGFYLEGDKNSIPVRGAYAMFEPTKNGTLSIYILQNGCITNPIKNRDPGANSGWTDAKVDFNGEVAWRPFYIVDEAGHSVPDVTYKVNNTLKMTYSDIEDIVASHKETTPKDTSIPKSDDNLVYYYMNPSTGARAALDETRRTALINQWKSEENNKDSVKVLAYPDKNGTSYLVTGKSYVKYEFPVQAGKSYFIFSNSSKLGLCGFKFHVTDTSEPVAISLDNKVDTYNAVTDKYANVTLAGRTFTKGRWTTLCLPFAVSATQMRQTFGDNVQLIEFDKTVLIGQKDTTANGKEETFNRNTILLKNHINNQIVAAGVPYLIKPGNNIDAGKAVINNVYFPATPVEPQTVDVGNKYKWKGVFENETLGNGDYYISGKDGSFKYYTTENHPSNSFRGYLDLTNGSGAKSIVFSAISFGSAADDPTTTGIGEIKAADIDATTINTGKIYNINGQVVSNDSTDLNSLPKGIYIVNGKKYVVK